MKQIAKELGEKDINKVAFTFVDGSEKVLEGKELVNWASICLSASDYLLPGNADHILAIGYGGIIQGFVPPQVIGISPGQWKRLE